MSRTAYAASQAAACRSRVREPADAGQPRAATSPGQPGPNADNETPDPLDTCAAVARLATFPDAIPELTRLLEAATGGPVKVLRPSELSRPPHGIVLPLNGGRGGALVLNPTVAAWSDPASAARVVLARLLDSMAPAARAPQSEPVAAALLADFEAERRELAERLHRGVLQSLIGSRYLFDLARTVEGRSAVEALSMARDAIQEALTEGRALLRDVTPRVGDRTSLQEEAGLLPGISLRSAGTSQLAPVVAAASYRLLQAVSRVGEPVTVSLSETGDRLRLTVGWLTDSDGAADREPSATGAGSIGEGLAPYIDRLRLVDARVVESGQQLVLDLPVAPRLPVQRAYRAVERQPAGPTTSTRVPRPTQRAPRRSEGNP